MRDEDWVVGPIPTQAREVRVVTHSPRLLAAYLNQICWNEMRGVEALSVAARYFSRIPKASLNFTRHNADEARHAAMFATRAVELGGSITPVPGRADVLNLLPGFKNEQQGGLDNLVHFLSRGYVEEYRGMLFFEAMAEALERDTLTQRLFNRISGEERMHVWGIREMLEPLASDGYAEVIPGLISRYQMASTVVI
jgi:hypothetical protein